MIMLACLINAFANIVNFAIWFMSVKEKKIKAHDAKGYFMIMVFVILLVAFAVGVVGQEQISTALILINTGVSLVSLTVAFVLIKDPVQY